MNVMIKQMVNRKVQRLSTGIVMSVISLLMTACSSTDHSQLHQRLDEIKSRPPAKIPTLPVFKPYETYKYTADKDADPFKGFLTGDEGDAEVMVSSESPLQGRNLETLEQYPLDTLRYVGQLSRGGEDWAIITSPDLIVHRVKVGNHLGTNYGQIIAIHEDKIAIEEVIPDEMGGWIKREAALSLTE